MGMALPETFTTVKDFLGHLLQQKKRTLHLIDSCKRFYELFSLGFWMAANLYFGK